jgi:hypothetical protein
MELLPPDSEELQELISNDVSRRIYAVLYFARPEALDIDQIRERLELPEGNTQQHLDRRLRSLDPYFEIKRGRDGRRATYLLTRRLENVKEASGTISKRVRAYVDWTPHRVDTLSTEI